MNITFILKRFSLSCFWVYTFDRKLKLLVENYSHYCQISCLAREHKIRLYICEMSTCKCHRTRERFDIMKLKVLFLLNCESSKYMLNFFSSVYIKTNITMDALKCFNPAFLSSFLLYLGSTS